jgi:hypothetical protein
MNTGVDGLIHTEQKHPAVVICQRPDQRKRIVHPLAIDDRI